MLTFTAKQTGDAGLSAMQRGVDFTIQSLLVTINIIRFDDVSRGATKDQEGRAQGRILSANGLFKEVPEWASSHLSIACCSR